MKDQVHSHSMVGMAESASDTRMEEKKQGEMGRYRRKQCRSKSTMTMWKARAQGAVTLVWTWP